MTFVKLCNMHVELYYSLYFNTKIDICIFYKEISLLKFYSWSTSVTQIWSLPHWSFSIAKDSPLMCCRKNQPCNWLAIMITTWGLWIMAWEEKWLVNSMQMKFAWKPLLQSQKNALQSSSLLWHMIKGGLIMIKTMVGTNMVGAPWKLALLETMKKSSLVICSIAGS